MEEKFLSIIILDIKNHFLTPHTIESIKRQVNKNFEIIVLTQNIKPSDFNFLKNEGVLLKEVEKGLTIPQIRNYALKLAQGHYLHFLFPGESYLSKFSLDVAFREIKKENYPDLVCFAFIKRDFTAPPEVKQVSFNLSFLGGERFPIFARDSFFSKKALEEIGGFDERYKALESFDVISRLFLKKGSKTACLRNVLVDFELQKYRPQEMLKILSDMIAIIYREYGFLKLFHFQIIKEMFDFFLYLLKDVKHYFIQKE